MPKYEDRAKARIRSGVPRFVRVLEAAGQRGITEADTVALVRQIMGDLLGYDPILDVTGEYELRGRYADLAVKMDGKPRFFAEVKALGRKLRPQDVQ
ncbi:MAG: hypothetical protein HY320_09995 [Armatimonadetes bacterium]|nr:hypothetical protein [Armatimonadota bacterium]